MCSCCLPSRLSAFKAWKETMDLIDANWLKTDETLRQEAKAFLRGCIKAEHSTLAVGQVVRDLGYNRSMKKGELATICLQVGKAYSEVNCSTPPCYTEDDRELIESVVRGYFGY